MKTRKERLDNLLKNMQPVNCQHAQQIICKLYVCNTHEPCANRKEMGGESYCRMYLMGEDLRGDED